jgi:crossover junction endodeoxyribonuclease RusA
VIRFLVPGLPQPKGSSRAYVRGGRAIVVPDNKVPLGAWTERVAIVARQSAVPCHEGPVTVALCFRLSRPQSHFGAKGVKPSAPNYPAKKPDVDKLARAVLDALTGVAYRDDAQVVTVVASKIFAGHEEPAGVVVEIGEKA